MMHLYELPIGSTIYMGTFDLQRCDIQKKVITNIKPFTGTFLIGEHRFTFDDGTEDIISDGAALDNITPEFIEKWGVEMIHVYSRDRSYIESLAQHFYEKWERTIQQNIDRDQRKLEVIASILDSKNWMKC